MTTDTSNSTKADPVKVLGQSDGEGNCMDHVMSYIWGDTPYSPFTKKYHPIEQLTCAAHPFFGWNNAAKSFYSYLLELCEVSKHWKAAMIQILDKDFKPPPEGFQWKDLPDGMDMICDHWIRTLYYKKTYQLFCMHKRIQPLLVNKILPLMNTESLGSINLRLYVPDIIQEGAAISSQRRLQQVLACRRYTDLSCNTYSVLTIRIEANGVNIEDYISPDFFCHPDIKKLFIEIELAQGVGSSLDFLFFSKLIQNLPSLRTLTVYSKVCLVPSGSDAFCFQSKSLENLSIIFDFPVSASMDCPMLIDFRINAGWEDIVCRANPPPSFLQGVRAGITETSAFFHGNSAVDLSIFMDPYDPRHPRMYRLKTNGFALEPGNEAPPGLNLASSGHRWNKPE